MATETLELKTPELVEDSTPKEKDAVTDSEKVTEKNKTPVIDDSKDEAMEEKGEEENNGERGKSPVTPVSERPTRVKKRTARYILDTPPRSSGNKPVTIEQGRGTRLKEIPNVAYKLSKRKPDDNLFLLHTILYGKKGKAQMLKKNIGQFSGFVWSEQEEEKQRARTKEKLEKCNKEKLIDICDVLDIPINKSNVKKDELAVRVLEFLVYPKATRDIVLVDSEKETKKRKKSAPKNMTSGESSDVPAKKKRQTKKSGKKQDQAAETEKVNGEADVGSEGKNDSPGENDVAPEEENNRTEDAKDKAKDKKESTNKKRVSKKTMQEKPAAKEDDVAPEEENNRTEDAKDKTKDKKESVTNKKRVSKKTMQEKPAAKEEKSLKGSAKSSQKSSKQVDKSSSSSSKKQKVDKEDFSKEKDKKQTSEPQAKGSKDQGKSGEKGKKEPTRKELHVLVIKILKEVDFNTATLSDILQKLGSHFGVDLMHRKGEVKDIITDAINEMSDDEEEEKTG